MSNTVPCAVRKVLAQDLAGSCADACSPAITGKENGLANISGKKSSGKKRGPKPKTDEEKEQAKKQRNAYKTDAKGKHEKSEFMAGKGFKTLGGYVKLMQEYDELREVSTLNYERYSSCLCHCATD